MNPDSPLASSTAMQLQGELQITQHGQTLGGKRQMALLQAIGDTGSITQAAKAVGMSYKAAWDTVDAINQLAGEPLVQRATGGKGGGGTRLTQRGQQLVQNFRQIEAEHQRFVAALQQQAAALADDYLLLRRLTMKTSARNQFAGTVKAVQHGAVNDEVVLALGSGHEIVAIVTHDSALDLGLALGTEAIALIKSSAILLATAAQGTRFSARNALAGVVNRVRAGAVNTEVVLDIGGGQSVAAVVTDASAQEMGLQPGMPALALFKASSVIVAVPV